MPSVRHVFPLGWKRKKQIVSRVFRLRVTLFVMNVNEVVNGRIYSVIFAGAVKMNKGGRGGVPENPLLNLPVHKRTVSRMQACSRASYVKRALKGDPSWSPSEKPSGFEETSHACVDLNLKTGEYALRVWAMGVVKHEVFIGNRLATEAELETIAAYQPGGKFYPESQAKSAPGFMRLPLEKIVHEGFVDGEKE